MANIRDFQLNTHYTALKQLPDQYVMNTSFGGTYGTGFGQVIASADVSVPAGSYVENVLLWDSITKQNITTHDNFFSLSDYGASGFAYLDINVSQINSSTYRLQVILHCTQQTTVPQSTARAILRLAQAPFDA